MATRPGLKTPLPGAERSAFGPRAVVSRLGRWTLVHLDNPTDDEVSARERSFDPRTEFPDDCRACRQARAAGGILLVVARSLSLDD